MNEIKEPKSSHQCCKCDGTAKLQSRLITINYKNTVRAMMAYFYFCEKCQSRFTTSEVDTYAILKTDFITDEYRERLMKDYERLTEEG